MADNELFGISEQLDDTISRRAAIETALTYLVEYCGAAFDEDMQRMLKERLDSLPSAQPEIIRCKDCKYARLTYDGSCKYCDVWFPDEAEYMDGDYYCASAERKSNG